MYTPYRGLQVTDILQADFDGDKELILVLFREYLTWMTGRLLEDGGGPDLETTLRDEIANMDSYRPPYGRLLFSFQREEAAGLVCLRKIREHTGEIRHMYVRERFRRKGIGRKLIEAALAEAAKVGYVSLRLESARFMTAV